MAHSVNECHRKIEEWQEKAQEAAREMEWWSRELQLATEEEARQAKDK